MRLVRSAALAGTAVAVLAAGGCADGDAVRIEGPGLPHAKPATAAPNKSGKLDVVALLKNDPEVSGDIKRALEPCREDGPHPIDASFGSITGGNSPDIVVNVHACVDGIGIGSYVYKQRDDGAYVNVFTVEKPPAWARITHGDLEVVQQTYADGDPVCCPSHQTITTYRWKDGAFRQAAKTGKAHGERKQP
jgi:hypothetical protein